MTQKRILELAWHESLHLWARENEFLKAHPDDELAMIREKKAYDEHVEISKLLYAEEQKEQAN